MKFKDKYRIFLYKKYLDMGLGLTNYVKYIIAFFGIASSDVKATLWIAFFYAIFSFFLGLAYFKYKWAEVDAEIANNYNPFVKFVKRKI